MYIDFKIKNIVLTDKIIIKHLSYQNASVTDLDLSIFSNVERERFDSFISDRRRIEFYFTRLLWKQFGIDSEITYGPEGNPLITEGFIGISHSKNNVVIAHSPYERPGIDIENYSEKVIRVGPKFMSDNESARFGMKEISVLTTIWSLKEAVYKMRCEDHLNFKENIEVLEIEKQSKFAIHLNGHTEIMNFHILPEKESVITYCIHEN